MVFGKLQSTYSVSSRKEKMTGVPFSERLEQHIGGVRFFNESPTKLALFESAVIDLQYAKATGSITKAKFLEKLDDIFESLGPTNRSTFDNLKDLCKRY